MNHLVSTSQGLNAAVLQIAHVATILHCSGGCTHASRVPVWVHGYFSQTSGFRILITVVTAL